MPLNNTVRIYGIPMDLGQLRRGVDMGPSAIRYAGLYERLRKLGYTPTDAGNIVVPQVEQIKDEYPTNARFLNQVTQVCQDTYDLIKSTLKHDEYGIFLGGDHSLSIGTVSAVSQMGKVGVLWVDAHADMNSPQTSPSGNIHGMSVATLLGVGPESLINIGGAAPKLKPRDVAMVGLRNLDTEEKNRVAGMGLKPYTMRDVDELGMFAVAHQILEWFADYDYLHISLDLDGCDPSFAPGVGTPVNGGLTYREAHLLMEILHDSGKVRTLDVVEVNPVLDERNRTADIAVDLVASLFGQQIM